MEENPNQVFKDERFGKFRELFYYYDENGQFEKKVHYHGETGKVIIQQSWDMFNERIERARQKVLTGKASPVVYYMEKIFTDPLNLSIMTGIPFWKVKLHLKPYFFNRLNDKVLHKYAEIFNVTVDQLKQVE